MDSVDVQLLKYLTKRDNYEELIEEIDSKLCTKESWQLVQDFKNYYETHPNANEIDGDFKLWFRVTAHPGWKQDKHRIFTTIIDNVLNSNEPDSDVFFEQLENMRAVQTLRRAMRDLEQGQTNVTQVIENIREYQPRTSISSGSECFFDESIQRIIEDSQDEGHGLFWRLEDLNKSIGPLKKGDFVIIAKRPEVGGTSFLCSELTFMLEQTNGGKAVLFNNEEENRKVKERLVTSALGVDGRFLYTNPIDTDNDYLTWLGNREMRLASHEVSSSIRNISDVLDNEADGYSVIGVNVLGTKIKIPGMTSEPDHDKLQELGERFRQLAHKHAPIIAVVQADPSATNQRYIPQDFIYKSKTALQGEADALIMIGKIDEDPEHIRYFHVAKNKMSPHPCTDSTLKHLKSEVHFDPDTGRFTSVNWTKGHSKDGKYTN